MKRFGMRDTLIIAIFFGLCMGGIILLDLDEIGTEVIKFEKILRLVEIFL